MKKLITSLCIGLALSIQVQAQTDVSVSTGAGYMNNAWYSLDNGDISTESATNWDIAFAATASQASTLAATILFNPKQGILSVAPVSVANFATLDTTGMTWTPLYNGDEAWNEGAFNSAAGSSPFDFGFGAYNMGNHSVEANRVFVIRYGSPGSYVCRKLYITLNSMAGTYTLVYDKLDNSDTHNETLTISTYHTKNFFYYSLLNNTIVDREPVKSSWDLLFTQYVSTSELYGTAPNQFITGVLVNEGVKVAQANNVDQVTYEDHASLTFSSAKNTIGWDWKLIKYNPMPPTWIVVTDTVYFVKQTDGDIFRLYFTSFGGSSNGTYNFKQEKLSTVTGLFASTVDKASLAIYPNPSQGGHATVVYDFNNSADATLKVCDLNGNVLYTEQFTTTSGLNTHRFSTASLKAGMYVVSVAAEGGMLTQKLIIN